MTNCCDKDRSAVAAAVAAISRPCSVPLMLQGDVVSPQNCRRLVILGSARVGKTSIVNRFLNNKFEDKYTPTIEDFHRKVYRIRGETYRLDILDTSGINPFPAMKRLSLLTGDLFLLVYCVDSRESFEEVQRLYSQILELKGQSIHTATVMSTAGAGVGVDSPGSRRSFRRFRKRCTPIVFVGNKCDKEGERVVDSSELRQLSDTISTTNGGRGLGACLEASAKQNINIDEIFQHLFEVAKLPTEMSPSLHHRVQPSYIGGRGSPSGSPLRGRIGFNPGSGGSLGTGCSNGVGEGKVNGNCGKRGVTLRRRLSDACGAVTPNVRRPSIRTDLLLLQARRDMKNSSDTNLVKKEKCVIQ